ncbi:hypothetical protein J1G44_13010 [Cellulomonas sp. zg-ZUI199]|uniref:Lipoprotein n=1 Tax=Cellulomonas wangleii TaxID=2816956 RepID=A0ABX8DCW2_9CELL|nr:hypothetical protein [Cellulomonas wangleii]QVI64262.1 hypothetical protein KG103_11415 [Cellulomonas wangleii]
MRGCVVVLLLAVLAACTTGTPGDAPEAATPAPSASPDALSVVPAASPAAATVVDGDEATAAVSTSAALLDAAPVAVVAAAGDVAGGLTGATAAVALGAPLLLAGGGTDAGAELARLGTAHLLVVGDVPDDALPAGVGRVRVPSGADGAALAAATGHRFGSTTPVPAGGEADAVRALAGPEPDVLVLDEAPVPAAPSSPATATPAPAGLPSTAPTAVPDVLALADGPVPTAALATLRALDVDVLDVPGGDPRATTVTVQALAQADPAAVVAFGPTFGQPDLLAARVATARTGVELPGGGQLVFPAVAGQPGKKYVALYGTPGSGALGVLGEQDVPATVARAQEHAAMYAGLTSDTVVPAVEIIATIASAGPEDDQTYSRRRAVDDLRPLVDAAAAAGQYVLLDLQPGRTDFVTQAQAYAELLELPHVGLALDPEWRLAPDQVHLRQIGSVGIDEVNATAAWLAGFTRERALPQKMFVLHQFSLRMITERERLDTSYDELAPLIHVDGQGSQGAKAGTWAALRAGAPPVHWGWKNFYDEDLPMLDPAATYRVEPVPDLVTYQ